MIGKIKFLDNEEIFPLCLSILFFFISVLLIPKGVKIPPNFDNLLTAVTTFSSILLGFLSVSLTILLSIKNSELIKYIFKFTNREKLKRYFQVPIVIGFLYILLTISLYFYEKYVQLTIGKMVLCLWISIGIYFLSSSYRVIDIVLSIVFKDPHATEKRPESKAIDPTREQELKEKYKIK